MLVLAGLAGCAKRPPVMTEVEGTLLMNNAPLPFAQIEFMPELSGFGAEYNSTAVTDAKGQFKLTRANGEPGAAVAPHRVVVSDPPPPPEARGMSGESQAKLSQWMARLANRPIPEYYSNYSQTTLKVEVKADQKKYELKMTR
jgi:hypothetical protein